MSFFGVTVEVIDKVLPIEGADRIEVATLRDKDFQFIIAKGSFFPGDQCLYFPVDSLIPPELAIRMGIAGKLSNNRVKTIRMKGQISQGLVASIDLVPKDTLANGCEVITEYLGITKYEAPEIFCKTGSSSNLPEGLHKYDIEGADRYLSIIQSLYDSKVLITEKLEGTNFSVHINSENVFVNSRTRTIREYDDNTYWSVAKKQNVIDFAKHLVSKWKKPVTIYGEMIGPNIQKNIYKKAHHEVFFFDISIGFQWLNPEQFIGEISEFYVNPYTRIVPILHIGILSDWLKNKTVKEASNGESIMTKGVRREGIVLRPWIETHSEIGRLILKQRSPEYLSRSEF